MGLVFSTGSKSLNTTPMKRPVLFLDVDGVLHPLRLEFKDGKLIDEHCFQKPCMKELKRVVKATGADIVLSSSWRHYETSRERLQTALAPYGLSFTQWTTTYEYPGVQSQRASQILTFLEEHSHEVGAWAVVDDEEVVAGEGLMMEVLRQRFVMTDGATGLTPKEADALIEILMEKDSDSDDGTT